MKAAIAFVFVALCAATSGLSRVYAATGWPWVKVAAVVAFGCLLGLAVMVAVRKLRGA